MSNDNNNELTLPPIMLQKEVKNDGSNSVYLETNNIKLICTIKGPYFSNIRGNDESKMDISVSIKIPAYIENKKGLNINYLSDQLKYIFTKHFILEKYPRTKLDIILQIFEYESDFFPYCIMVTSLCSCYSLIEQRGILSCCEIFIDNKGEIKFKEDKDCKCSFIIGCNISLKENFLFKQNGYCDEGLIKKVLSTSIKICDIYHKYLIKKM